MLRNQLRTFINAGLLSFIFVLAVIAATPKTGASDVPELPKGNGMGDVPDMLIDLVPLNLGAVAKKQDYLKLSSLRGRVVLIDIFWSRCPHCEEHAPHIVELYNKYRQRGFTVLGLATDRKDDREDLASLKQFMQKAKINYTVGFLTTEIRAYYADPKDAGVPQMVLFGKDGKMVLREVGWNQANSERLIKALEAQLGKAPAVQSVRSKAGSVKSKKP
ncbi:MAG: TlpA family protein disulfide reductase [Blastocatellales bacterium]